MRNVKAYFRVLKLERFILEDINEPIDPKEKNKWQEYRYFIIVHLIKAINIEILNDIETLDWDEENLYNIIIMAQKAVTKVLSDSLR